MPIWTPSAVMPNKPAPAGRVELLAPAGERAAAYAAFAFGADAVYTGLPRFSARAEAVNLSSRELEEITTYAHSRARPKRVYVTLNTLIREEELPEVVRALALCEACGVDAVIVQDLGVARLVRRHFPSLKLHASTQLALHNLEGVQAAARLGFRRVTLARELTLDEIRSIARKAPVEIEIFLHGALCYSYSGLCLYSALLRQRSGNRGACAYPCRMVFHAMENKPPDFPHDGKKVSTRWKTGAPAAGGMVFSMKDLANGASIPELAAASVASLKIEGRKKSPLYVAAAVNYHRKLLDRSFQPGEQEEAARDLQTIFSRPWTPLYLKNRRQPGVVDPNITGHRGTPLGRVEHATRDYLQFRTHLPLEVHDGIQIDLPGEARPFGFAVEAITLHTGRRVFEAPADSLIEVPLPPQAPFLAKGTPLFLASSQAVKRRYRFDLPNPCDLRRRFPLQVVLRLSQTDLQAKATAKADGFSLEANATLFGPFEKAHRPQAVEQAVETAFSKLGDTPFTLCSLCLDCPDFFIPVSKLNALRRDLMDQLTARLQSAREAKTAGILSHLKSAAPEARQKSPAAAFLLKTDQPDVLLDAFPDGRIPRVTEVIVELGRASVEAIEALQHLLPDAIDFRLALPVITRSWNREALKAQIRHFLDRGQMLWEAANLSALDFLPRNGGIQWSADWPLYTLNTEAMAEGWEAGVRRFTLSPEDTLENIRRLVLASAAPFVWPVHRDPPLFISETCPQAAGGSCPGPAQCTLDMQTRTNKAGETVVSVNRGCRFYTLLERPMLLP
ncbi:MAG: U32 family peptidase, partial [Verrucomicrobiota bacterium]|nr:U32 family peptidase [Verrucomicrobiota bacterium]